MFLHRYVLLPVPVSPNREAPRPYDSTPVPPLDMDHMTGKGLRYEVYEVATPWTPDIKTLDHQPTGKGVTETIDPAIGGEAKNLILAFEGAVHVPGSGKYVFQFQTDGGAVIHLHRGLLIDADLGYEHGTLLIKEVFLEEGYHPVKIVYKKGGTSAPYMDMQWSGPDFPLQPVGIDDLYYY